MNAYRQVYKMYIVFIVLKFEMVASSQNLTTCRNTTLFSWRNGFKVNSLYSFESYISFSISECAQVCLRRKICKSANFLTHDSACQLNAAAVSSLTIVYDLEAKYIDRDEIFSVSIDVDILILYWNVLFIQ